MAYVDLSQDAAQMRRIFQGLGLAARDEAVHAVALTGGVSSGIYRVDLRSGSYCLKQALPKLKVAKDWQVPVERVFHEVAWLRAAQAIVPGHVPAVLGEDAETKSFVMPFLGAEYRNWKTQLLAGQVDADFAVAVGDVLGRIHAATAGDAAVARAFATDANFHSIRLEPYLVETARVHPDLASRLLALVDRTASHRLVLVHGDVSPKNILAGPAGPVLLDAECAWFGDPAFDVAFCLNHFLLKAAHLPQHGASLLGAAAALADAYWPHVHWERRAALEARVASLLPALALARVDGKSPVEYLHEEERARVRSSGAELVGGQPETLAEITGFWQEEFLRA
jgi:aminoglycoside phosphotransferase (APT) family kinase protein